ncbi:peptidylprolyl isomerase [Chengkuizengella sediminis]|uniref:peptidylprolyl isomerase n=1 Tax=Chengkuizengella sediminis TaxID=1885917 RepID=UPI001389649E|nr:peptidylprolyl isomerase [Chengkuizengella sediminis]NDI33444.1 hypothetical protein [Chengkuizengella sediminis]
MISQSFAELAQEYSVDPSASNDGDLGFIRPGDREPEFEEEVLKLGVGEYTKEPVQIEDAFHIIKVTEKEEKKPFEEMKNQIRDELTTQKLNPEETQGKINNLIHEINIKINDEELKDLFKDLNAGTE